MNIKTLDPNAESFEMDNSYFLIGLISRFNNSFQMSADNFFEELSWKQIFFLNCIKLFQEAPTIKEMAELIGCSHQNAKQILSKLEKAGYVSISKDEVDRRKQRIAMTEKAKAFEEKYSKPSDEIMEKIFAGIKQKDIETTIKVLTQLDEAVKEI
ncbi:MAG: MarR family transcriptional regulator [Lachnospiraceae bacterium]|nr:MarR family transcriptional regulator [Lachnospiraceae bacterium]MDD3617248.1 MarR family transcriptional regulator [Lachnospiraceae bacterium]